MIAGIVLAGLCGSWILFAAYMNHGRCVVLPNGDMIGHVAIFKLEPDTVVDMVLRDASGKIVVRTDGFVNFEFHPTDPNSVLLEVPGRELDLDARVLMPTVLEETSSWDYVRKWQKVLKGGAGSTHILGTGLYAIYERLRLSPKFENVYCGTP